MNLAIVAAQVILTCPQIYQNVLDQYAMILPEAWGSRLGHYRWLLGSKTQPN